MIQECPYCKKDIEIEFIQDGNDPDEMNTILKVCDKNVQLQN